MNVPSKSLRACVSLSLLAMAMSLTGCGDDSPVSSASAGSSSGSAADTTGGSGTTTPPQYITAPESQPDPGTATTAARTEPATRYDMANACYGLREQSTGRYLAKQSDGSYQFTAGSPTALPIYFKPTALGEYLLSLPDSSLLAASGSGLGTVTATGDAANWEVDGQNGGPWTLTNVSSTTALTADANGKVTLGGTASPVGFAPTSGCTTYPEITTNTEGPTFAGTLPDGTVLGFADAHVHWGATTFLGGAHYGSPFDRFGVTSALKDCSVAHGPNGTEDFVGNLEEGNGLVATHDTQGWPTFASWPAANMLTHEGMYYRWVQRAYKSGLRLMVNELVENQVLCTLNSTLHTKPQDCNEMNEADKQAAFMHSMQDYVDAQSGGPGKGWFVIVSSPEEARQAITQGKLAVVLGVEISHIFNCNVKYLPVPGVSAEQDGCTQADIDNELNHLYSIGVRQLFPTHEFDNALGGNGIFDGFILNVGNFVDTNKFWTTYDCPDVPYLSMPGSNSYTAGAYMQSVGVTNGPGLFNGTDPLSSLLRSLLGGNLPVYKSDKRQCNQRSLTSLGQYAIGRMMDKGMIIDLDHMELKQKSQVLALAKARSNGSLRGYPVTSTHGGHGGITAQQAQDIYSVGGLIYQYHDNGKNYAGDLPVVRKLWSAAGSKGVFGFGFGADMNGMAVQASPRPSGSTPVQYPFTLFSGADWDPALFSQVKPMQVDQQKSGEHLYNTDKDGMAHYGMLADWVEEVRIEGGKDALDALYHSAEAYLQMWSRARSFATQGN